MVLKGGWWGYPNYEWTFWGFFFPPFLWCNYTFDYAQEELTKFGDMIKRKIQNSIIVPIFLQFIGTHLSKYDEFYKKHFQNLVVMAHFSYKSPLGFLYCCYYNVKIPPHPPQRVPSYQFFNLSNINVNRIMIMAHLANIPIGNRLWI